VTFRISSLEPMDCPRGIVDLVAGSGRFARHFHLPLQHGADRVLAAMRRPYSVAYYRDLVEDIRARLPHASIGADVMVGFPGESDVDARESERVIEALPLSYLHVFPYSDRPNTAAAAMAPKVNAAAVRDRAARMRDIGARLSSRFLLTQLGTVRPGLTIDDGSTVLTDNFLKVAVSPGLTRNTRVNVQLDAGSPVLRGRLV
jgi:threonylcarbamoyladenosine tRNA methylthiotransferase MtaB